MNHKRGITIDGRRIASDMPPYVVAELSANHNGSLERAVQILEAARTGGANAVKLQTYRADTITLKCKSADFQIDSGPWQGQTLYDLYQEAHTPWEWHGPLFTHARKIGITIFSSPFDTTAVDYLEDLGNPAYKIASFEAIDLPLIAYAASTRKPLIISTGMANELEIREAIETAREQGCEEIALLHCVSGYPAPAKDYNLRTIPDMSDKFDLVTGISDHTLDNATAVASVALGASLIEKHLTIDRAEGGPDSAFSLQPPELEQLCRDALTAWEAMGSVDYGTKPSEKENLKFRRSLYFVKDLSAGEMITDEAVRSVRPGYGLAPKHLREILGKRVIRDVSANTAATWDYIEK